MPQSKEFDAGFDRVFGKPKAKNKGGRWVYDAKQKKLVPLTEGWVNPDSKRLHVFGESHYDGIRSADGREDLSSKAKHRAYMKEHGLVLSHECVETKAKARKKREDYLTGNCQETKKAWAETFGRKLHEIESRKRRTGR